MGTVLPIKELASRIQAAGIDDVRPVVTTCGSGITACVLALGLHLTGRPRRCRLRRVLDRMGRPRGYTGSVLIAVPIWCSFPFP